MSSQKKLIKMWKDQDGKCYFCQRQTLLPQTGHQYQHHTATKEHLVPKSLGGSNRKVNLKMSCYFCNKYRENMDALLWLRIVNDSKKLKAFHTARLLRKRLSRIRKFYRLKRRIKSLGERRSNLIRRVYFEHRKLTRQLSKQLQVNHCSK